MSTSAMNQAYVLFSDQGLRTPGDNVEMLYENDDFMLYEDGEYMVYED